MDNKKLVSGLDQTSGFIQDIGYGIANIFGQGETANNLINKLKTLLQKISKSDNSTMRSHGLTNYQTTDTATDLVNYIMANLGDKPNELTKLLGKIDNALAKLPPALSQAMKLAMSGIRKQLEKHRSKVAGALNKVETTMSTALSNAASQSYYSPSQKIANQDSIKSMVESGKNVYNNIDLQDIERRV